MWMIRALPGAGWRQRSVVTEPARQPTKTTTSAASTIARVSGVPPFDPTTPAECAQRSSIEPLPLIVVATGAHSFSASVVNSASAPASTTPPPQMSNGDLEDLRSLAASSTKKGSGATLLDGKLPSVGSAHTSLGSTG